MKEKYQRGNTFRHVVVCQRKVSNFEESILILSLFHSLLLTALDLLPDTLLGPFSYKKYFELSSGKETVEASKDKSCSRLL